MTPKRSKLWPGRAFAWLIAAFLWGAVLLCWLVPGPVEAAPLTQTGSIQVQQNIAKVAYRNGVDFRINATLPGGEVTKAQLKVKFGKRGHEETYDVALTNGIGNYTLYEEADSLATGMPLIYSWTLSAGKVQLQTEPKTVVYEDVRYNWLQREGPQVTVRWYNGDGGYGSLMYQLAADSLATYKRRFNIDPTDQIYITIYGSSNSYHSTFPDVPSWSGGFSRYGGEEIVAIAPQDYSANVWIGEGIPHELSHAALYQFLRKPAPRWLDEGFAVYNQNTIDIKQYDDLVKRAYQTNSLIPLSNLNTRWPPDDSSANLAYAEGRSMVTFLINNYGNEVWSNLLDQLRRNDIDGAMQAVFGVDLSQMEDLWKTKMLAGRPVKMPDALLRGPVASQPSDADMKARNGAPADDGTNFWVILLAALVGTLVLISAIVFLVVRRSKHAENKYQREKEAAIAAYIAKYERPYAGPAATVPSTSGPPVYSGPADPRLPAIPPPLGGIYRTEPPELRRMGGQYGANPVGPAPSSESNDPFDLIMTNFGTNSQPKSGFHQVARPVESPSSLLFEVDPYGLNLGAHDPEKGTTKF
jgi:hypothetical protein